MRLLVHRGQALLLLLVGGLTGAAVVGGVMERDGLPAPVATRASGLLAQPKSGLPTRIEIGGPSPAPSSTLPGSPTASAVRPTAVTTVVPSVVYTYPPYDHGGGSPDPSGDGSGRGGHH